MTIRHRFLTAISSLAAVSVALLPLGCPGRPPPATKPGIVNPTDDPLTEIRDTAGMEHTVERCKLIVAALNVMLSHSTADKPIPTSAEERTELAKKKTGARSLSWLSQWPCSRGVKA